MFQKLMSHSHTLVPVAESPVRAGWNASPIPDSGYDLIDINELVTRGREDFIYARLDGDSMVPEIYPGSLLFIDPVALPKDGQPVVACLNGQVCVKLFERKPYRGLRLVSANKMYEPQSVKPEDDFNVIGVVRAALTFFTLLISTLAYSA